MSISVPKQKEKLGLSRKRAMQKGRLVHSSGAFLHFSGLGHVEEKTFSWFGTFDQALLLIETIWPDKAGEYTFIRDK